MCAPIVSLKYNDIAITSPAEYTDEKYYIADHGIREAVFGGNMRDIKLILENIVYLELLRRGYEVTVGRTGDKEIDFVCGKRGEKLYVQVTYLLASGETVNREFGAYDSVRDNFPKYVVSLDEFDMSRNGIKHRNIRDFLFSIKDFGKNTNRRRAFSCNDLRKRS